ncbi:MAG: rod shape-determining protein [Clostridia bacterium]|nr:rod shape-determining protein [Clostridia bacterium]
MAFNKNFITTDVGIDLGTSTVLVYVKDKGIVIREPSVVAIDNNTNKIVRIGKEAQQMLGRTPENISIIRPLKDGVISQYSITLKMLEYFIDRACGYTLIRPRVMICVPSGINEAEEMTVINATNQAGARQTLLIEEPVAAAIGAGIDINKPEGHMVVDIGGGTTDIAVISYGGVVASESIRIAGNELDSAIMSYMRKKYKVLIGERTAEEIKIKVGKVFDVQTNKQPEMNVRGRCLIKGLPKVVSFNANETLDALIEPLTAIIDTICLVIERTPPELLGDIYKNGIVLTGGGSKLTGLDKLIEKTTGIRTYLAKDPISCVVLGTGKSLEELEGGAKGLLGSFGNG